MVRKVTTPDLTSFASVDPRSETLKYLCACVAAAVVVMRDGSCVEEEGIAGGGSNVAVVLQRGCPAEAACFACWQRAEHPAS